MANEVFDLYKDLAEVDLAALCERTPRLKLARKIAAENKFMHWELEFADLFIERGGFDLVIGNPPWIKMTWNEQGVLSDKHSMPNLWRCCLERLSLPKYSCAPRQC